MPDQDQNVMQKPLTIRDVLVPNGKLWIAAVPGKPSAIYETEEKAIAAGADARPMIAFRLRFPESGVMVPPEKADDDLFLAQVLARQVGQLIGACIQEAAQRAGPQLVVAGAIPPEMPGGPGQGPPRMRIVR